MRPTPTSSKLRLSTGYAYLEVLIASIILSVSLVPASDALRDVVRHSQSQRSLLATNYAIQSLLETVLTAPYTTLEAEISSGTATATNFSDIPGTLVRRIVYVLPYDADNADGDSNHFTGAEDGLLRIEVTGENTGITYTSVLRRPA